ncbi:MAG: nucleoside triphosphate pyrophosphohydrolase [Salinivirgaceae bacterium]|nr:nucleoside triphosphate pyrophosphohydrolase [Salinivirgaceae bacterium]
MNNTETTELVMNVPQKRAHQLQEFNKLLDIMDELRAKCPWDGSQTFDSLRTLTIEETYELADAIISKNMPDIKKELGDVLLHIIFYAKIADEQSEFDIADVIDALNQKMIYRHPHVFGGVNAPTADDVSRNWEQLKLKEKGRKSNVLEGVPASLPALVKAYRMQEKTSSSGFDWEKPEQVWDKVNEELAEFSAEMQANPKSEAAKNEFGDLLFSLVNAGRLYKINPEDALERTNQKFLRRFNYVEQKIKEQGKQLRDCDLAEMDKYWNEAKSLENK